MYLLFIARHTAVSTHSRLKAADDKPKEDDKPKTVSTHSRLKAADRHRI